MTAPPDLPKAALDERDALVARLMELIQTATGEEVQYIAEADPGATPAQIRKQEAALRTILFKRRGRLTEKHEQFPGEVLSLVAEDPDEHLDRAFEIATAVLMITALLNDDQDGAMSLCWAAHGAAYAAMDSDFRAPILEGFGWLSRHATDWEYLHEPGAVPSPGTVAAVEPKEPMAPPA